MTHDELIRIQRRETNRELYPLVTLCRRRFLRSAYLVGMRGPFIDRLREFGVSDAVDLLPLFPAWQLLCHRYMSEIYDSQLGLFTKPETQTLSAWTEFLNWTLFADLVREDEFVRNVLRALGGLPCQSPEQAAAAVCQYFLEMTLPFKSPPWTPEEEID